MPADQFYLANSRRLKRGMGCIHLLPMDVFLRIISPLPLKDALNCRLVCKTWLDMVTGSYFSELLLKKPIIVCGTFDPARDRFIVYILKNWWKDASSSTSTTTRSIVHELKNIGKDYVIHCAGAGCLVMRKETEFVVCNPAYRHKVKIVFPREGLYENSKVYGVYFHPILEEYCIMWRVEPGLVRGYYMILNLGLNTYRKNIENPWSHRIKNRCKSVVSVNNYLYWLLEPRVDGYEDIMEFDIINEKFRLLEDRKNDFPMDYDGVDLVIVNGVLALFVVSVIENAIYAWMLKDREREIWTTSFTYKINSDQVLVSFKTRFRVPVKTRIRVIAYVDGELLIQSNGRLVAIDLKLGTARELNYYFFEKIWPYGLSLASLKKSCGQSKINIEDVPFFKGLLSNKSKIKT